MIKYNLYMSIESTGLPENQKFIQLMKLIFFSILNVSICPCIYSFNLLLVSVDISNNFSFLPIHIVILQL